MPNDILPSPGKIPTPNRNKSEYSVLLNVQMYPAEEEEEALIVNEMNHETHFSVPTYSL